MIQTFMFYDFETFGINVMRSKPSQIGIVMTDSDLNVIGDSIEYFCKPMVSSMPEIPACLITGFTPEKLLAMSKENSNVYNEYDFFQKLNTLFQSNSNMCVLGYNSYKYDDEIIRHGFFRNLISPYEREYSKGNSKFDIFHYTRAFAFLFPDQIVVPFDEELKRPVFKLESLAKANNLDLTRAHDALSDVYSTIALAKHMKDRQPEFWEHALKTKDKNSVINFVNNNKEFFLYSPYFSHEKGYFGFTHVLDNVVGDNPSEKFTIVSENLDDIKAMLALTPAEIAEEMNKKFDERKLNIPIASFKVNGGPFMFTTKGLAAEGIKPTRNLRETFDLNKVQEARIFIHQNIDMINEFVQKVIKLKAPFVSGADVDMTLYNNFIDRADNFAIKNFHADMNKSNPDKSTYEKYFTSNPFKDDRLNQLARRVILRNYYSEDLGSDILNKAYCDLLKAHLGTDYAEDTPYQQKLSNLSLNEFQTQIQDYLSQEEYKDDPIILSLKKYGNEIREHYNSIVDKYDVKPKSLKP